MEISYRRINLIHPHIPPNREELLPLPSDGIFFFLNPSHFEVGFLLVREIATVDLPDLKHEIQKIISKL